MREALIFNGANALDFQDIRVNVVRIPEVVHRIRQAQEVWDSLSKDDFDLANFIASDDQVFLSHIRFRNFASAVVQVGLFDRFLRNHVLPDFLIGAVNGDSPLRVALKEISFTELVADSQAMNRAHETISEPTGGDMPVLSGVQLAEYAVYQKTSQGFKKLFYSTMDVQKMVESVVQQNSLERLVFVGPGNGVVGKNICRSQRDLQISESIDLDPMLSWFWRQFKETRLAVAN